MATYDIVVTKEWSDSEVPDESIVNLQNRYDNKIEYRVQTAEPDAEDIGLELFPAPCDTPAVHTIKIASGEFLWVRMLRAATGKEWPLVAVDA